VQIPHHILTTHMELWGFIKPSTSNQAVHTKFSLHLSFYLRCSLRGYTVGATTEFLIEIMEALARQPCHRIQRMCPQQRMSTYSASRREDIFTTLSTEGSEAIVRAKYPGYRGPPVTTQNSGYDWFCPAANDWGTIHLIPDKTPPLQAKVEGPPT
jgi:hypothetical protein